MIILKGAKPSPFVRKVIVALEEKGIPYQLENLAPFPKTPELLAISPLGKIPVLQDGDVHVPDSSVIIAYLERTQPGPSLYPEDPAEYARALFLEELADTRVVDVLGPLFFEKWVKPNVFQQETDDAVVERVLADELPPLLAQLEGFAPDDGGTLLSRFSVADAALCAQLMGLVFTGIGLDASQAPKLASYFDEMLARPSFKSAMPALG